MGRRGFHRRGDRVVLRLDEHEVRLLGRLLVQLLDLVAPPAVDPDQDPFAAMVGISAHAERPEDPALLRLFPDAYRQDEEAAADFRRYTETGLREQKTAHARTALATLDRGEKAAMSPQEAHAWLLALNDVRLVLGARLEISEEEPPDLDELDPQDPRRVHLLMYDWLTWLQSTAVAALTG